MTPKETFRKLIEYYHFPVGNDPLTKAVIEEMKKEVYRALALNEKQAEILRILKKYPKWAGSLGWLLRISRYWKEKKKEITKELLEIYDIPFEVDEFATIVEWLEDEKCQNKN